MIKFLSIALIASTLIACEQPTPCEVRSAAVCDKLLECHGYTDQDDCFERNVALCEERAVDFIEVRAEVCALDLAESECREPTPVSCDLNRETWQ